MNTKTDENQKELVSCNICMKEIANGKGKVSEVDDYVMHFCGLECYDKWHKKSQQQKINKE